MPHGVGYTHPVLAKQAELAIQFRVLSSEHAAVAGGYHLARVERETRHGSMRAADPFPVLANLNLAADRAGCILNHWKIVSIGHGEDCRHIARKADLVHRHDGPRARCDGSL